MENGIYFIIVAIVIIGIAVSIWKNRQEDTKDTTDGEPSTDGGAVAHGSRQTCDLLLDTLSKIGCQYQMDDRDEKWKRAYFAFQGERFIADASNDSVFVHLWDPNWKEVDLEDIDEVSRLRKAINTSNIYNSVTTVFSIDENENKIVAHCKSVMPLMSSMPDLDDYLRAGLNAFFYAHREVEAEMLKLREKEAGGSM